MRFLAYTAAALSWTMCSFSYADNVALTITDAIETVRAMKDTEGRSVFVSPDGLRYVTLLIKGDISRDGIWAELIAGRLDTFEGAHPITVARLFTRGLGADEDLINGHGATRLTGPVMNVPHWIDNRHVALLWEDTNGKNQVISVDIDAHHVQYLTHSAEDVISFSANGRGETLFAARVGYTPKRSEELLHEGFAVNSPDVLPLLDGIVDGTSMMDFHNRKQFAVALNGRTTAVEGIGVSFYPAELSPYWGSAWHQFSPNGEWALVDASPGAVSKTWRRYKDDRLKAELAEHANNPDDWYARQIQQLFVVNMRRQRAFPLWDAPTVPFTLKGVEWSPDGRSVLLGPTFLPPPFNDSASLSGNAVAEVEIATGRVREVPLPSGGAAIERIEWNSQNTVAVTLATHDVLRFQRRSGRWSPLPQVPPENLVTARVPPFRVEMREDLNTPPALFAVDAATGRAQVLLELNPQLKGNTALGHVEFVHWKDGEGLDWKGRLYYPVHFSSQRTYPLVIQTHGYADEKEFSLYGPGGYTPGLGPGWSVWLAQPLANRDFAVLQIGGPASYPDGSRDGAERAGLWSSGVEAAVEFLVAAGIVDGSKVGLMAHSATGRLVEHAITFSRFPYSAAIIADHADMNYLQHALLGWRAASTDWHGAPPFGDGLRAWIEHSPSFNAQRVHTPVQYQLTSAADGFGSLLFGWEMFSRLRHLKKPVEYYIVPDIQHGNHYLQNPRQLAVLQSRAMDWWLFWLTGQEDSDPRKAEQYIAWRKLRALHEVDIGSATPSSPVRSPIIPHVN
jgi:hypothetical protein